MSRVVHVHTLLWGMFGSFACGGLQDIADQAEGDNVLVVTHGDAVNSSVSRLMPWSVVYPVLHTGFTVAYRSLVVGWPNAPPPPPAGAPTTRRLNLILLPEYPAQYLLPYIDTLQNISTPTSIPCQLFLPLP